MIVGQTVRVAHDQYAETCKEDYTGMEGVVTGRNTDIDSIMVKFDSIDKPVPFYAEELEVVESVENRG